MKKIFFLVIFALFFQGGLSQQIVGINKCYVFSESDYSESVLFERFSVYLTLYRNGDYSIDLVGFLTDDLPLEIGLSYGYYKQENGFVELTDDCYGYNMFFQNADEDYLVATRSFSFLNKKKSLLGSTPTSMPLSPEQKFQIPTLKKVLRDCDLHNKKYQGKITRKIKIIPLSIGHYQAMSVGITSCLQLQSDKTFSYYIEDGLVLKGEWSRNGNILQLKDSVLQQTFYAPIYKEGISGVFLPGGWGMFFRIKSVQADL